MTVVITVITMVTTSSENCRCTSRAKLVSEKQQQQQQHVFSRGTKEPGNHGVKLVFCG